MTLDLTNADDLEIEIIHITFGLQDTRRRLKLNFLDRKRHKAAMRRLATLQSRIAYQRATLFYLDQSIMADWQRMNAERRRLAELRLAEHDDDVAELTLRRDLPAYRLSAE